MTIDLESSRRQTDRALCSEVIGIHKDTQMIQKSLDQVESRLGEKQNKVPIIIVWAFFVWLSATTSSAVWWASGTTHQINVLTDYVADVKAVTNRLSVVDEKILVTERRLTRIETMLEGK